MEKRTFEIKSNMHYTSCILDEKENGKSKSESEQYCDSKVRTK